MQKIFIDIGGNRGQSVRAFYAQIEDAADWTIFSFEPTIEFDTLETSTKEFKNIHCIKSVVGDRDGEVLIYTMKSKKGQGCSTVLGKKTGKLNYAGGELVRCIDLVNWFSKNIKEDDFVYMKINIEGGEYDLMPVLVKIMNKINCLYIKLHHNKFVSPQREDMLIKLEEFKSFSKSFSTKICLDDTERVYDFKRLLE